MSVTVRLNGSNYVSDKTRQAYEKALADGHRIQPAAQAQNPAPENGLPPVPSPLPASGQPASPITPAPLPIVIVKEQELTMPTLADYSRLLDSLDHGLAQSHDHQAQTLHVHEQYLSYQADYAKLFTQLLQQQGDIFAHGQVSPQQAELAAKVLDNLSQSMARFHDLQSDTLNVHKHFLDQQAEYSQGQVDILRQQSALAGVSIPSSNSQPASYLGNQPRETGHSERYEVHHTHGHHNGSGRGNGNGNGHGHQPAPVIEAAPVIRVPAVHPPTPERLTPAAPQPIVTMAAPAPAAPKPAVAAPKPVAQPPVSAVRQPAAPAPVVAAAPAAAAAFDAAALTSSLLAIVSEKTGYPADMLDLSMDMEADLGIDSIKRVEIMGALQERHPGLPKVEPQALAELCTLGQIVSYVSGAISPASPTPSEPAAQPLAAAQAAPPAATDAGELTSSLLAIVSEKTGYPADMLELSMDMEADLGIDSIKRVEIMGALQERHPGLPKVEPQALAELRTLSQIVSFIGAEPAAKKA
jgi:acyl carrier protein